MIDKKPSLLITVAVWGGPYIETFLTLALPSFLAPGNIPACAALVPIKFQVITRPEDTALFDRHPALAILANHAAISIEPRLTPDCFTGNRYAVMSLANRFAIAESLDDGAVLAILPPDCIIANGTLSFGMEKILAGDKAVLVCGPKGVLEEIAPYLTSAPYVSGNGTCIAVPSRDLVALQVTHPHAMSKILYWDRQPFTAFPSCIYWAAGQQSTLARYFHLHPLFVNMISAAPEARHCGTQDGDLILLAGITPGEIFVATDSDDMCVIELSRLAFDSMGAQPRDVTDKTSFVVDWSASGGACRLHREQFQRYTFRLQGNENVDWKDVISKADQNMSGVFTGLADLDRQEDIQRARVRKEQRAAVLRGRINNVVRQMHSLAVRLSQPRRVAKAIQRRIRKKIGA